MAQSTSQNGDRNPWRYILYGVIILSSIIAILLQGADIRLLNPKGSIAGQELNLMIYSLAVMLIIALPTLFLFYYFAWKYRETNPNAAYDPTIRHDKAFMVAVWAIPSFFMVVLGTVMWSSTHRLEPQKAIASHAKPLTIQVIALRWKWVFIYPEEKIATVNYVQVPINTPVTFELTADEAPMSSFWVPHLGGQLYAMTGHVNRLNLMAEEPGDYPGSSAEINGPGFAGMKFIARASSQEAYDTWLQEVRGSAQSLDSETYKKLVVPSQNNPSALYSLADTELYDAVIKKNSGAHESHTEHPEGHE